MIACIVATDRLCVSLAYARQFSIEPLLEYAQSRLNFGVFFIKDIEFKLKIARIKVSQIAWFHPCSPPMGVYPKYL